MDLVTVDINPDHKPDVVWDLSELPLPFSDDTFDTISAFDVMEHMGQQGDWRFFFDQYADIWRMLKPGGVFCGISPDLSSRWSFGDPGHCRVMMPENLVYLVQPEYEKQVGITPITDYRFIYKADFDVIYSEVREGQFHWMLKAVKPSRVAA